MDYTSALLLVPTIEKCSRIVIKGISVRVFLPFRKHLQQMPDRTNSSVLKVSVTEAGNL